MLFSKNTIYLVENYEVDVEVRIGKINPLGASLTQNGVNFAIYAPNATAIEIQLFDKDGKKFIQGFALFKENDFFHGEIIGANKNHTYGIKANGEYAPYNGNRFDNSKLLLDPYSLELTAPINLYDEMMEYGADTTDLVPKTRIISPQEFPQNIFKVSDEHRIIYELNIKGFSALNSKLPPETRGTFAGLASAEAIAYIKSLGVTSVELMPSAAWIDERHLKKQGLKNYWGYNPICYMAPDPKLAPNGWDDVQNAVLALNQAGIEVILDVVFNHSGESDEYGPVVSMRGLDNQNYYRLAEDKAKYINDAGTGNVLNAENQAVQNLIIDSLRAWVKYGGISGFRFDLAPTMLRNWQGVNFNSNLLKRIADDEILCHTTMIAEPWDIGYGGYQLGNFPQSWNEWSDKYRDIMREFWQRDAISLGNFAQYLCGSQNIFYNKQKPKSINFITAHDGFTLRDLVSFEHKNNYANGENNNDGHNHNISCNHGVEGITKQPEIRAIRLKHQKNLLLSLFLSRGTPMIYMGSEFGKSQNGNNNAYCQDNEISWLDWGDFDHELFEFNQKLIAIRKDFAPINTQEFLTGQTIDGLYPDIVWQNADGGQLSSHDWDAPNGKFLAATLYKNEQRAFIAFNRGTNCIVTLPIPRDDFAWKVAATTSENQAEIIDSKIAIDEFSSLILIEVKSKNKYPVSDETLDKICDKLEIAKSWWDIAGQETPAPTSSKIKILAALGLDCATEYAARKSLRDYVDKFILRPLPFYASFSGDEAQEVEIYSNSATALSFELKDENGNLLKFEFNGEYYPTTLPDGRAAMGAKIKLPHLSIGRYELWQKDLLNIICRITIAPQTCYLPDAKTIKGISAQIYSLKRKHNSVFGDFQTLKETLQTIDEKGYQILAINPLHILFLKDRDKKSPYYPSDRRFIEPLYIATNHEIMVDDDYIDYQKIWGEKLKSLEVEFEKFTPNPDYKNFCNSQGKALDDYALFESLSERFAPLHWYDWEIKYKTRDAKAIKQFIKQNQNRINFFKYLQYRCDKELAEATQNGAKIARDLAIGSAPMGCENWCEQELTAHGVSIGAPPDPLGPQGQVWGLPPKSPLAMIEDGFRNIASLFRINMKYAGALRIDHALGLNRQFWVADGMSGADGTYINFPFKHLMNELKLESQRAKCIVIAEDLGTVPNGFREMMESAKALSYKVIPFEKNYSGFKASSEYPHLSLACAATHDLPPIKGWWAMTDLKERFNLNLYSKDEFAAAVLARENEKTALIKTLSDECLLPIDFETTEMNSQLAAAIHAFLAKTDAILKIIQLEDLAGETIPINLPGTDTERKNWQKYIKPTLNEIFSDENTWSKTILSALS